MQEPLTERGRRSRERIVEAAAAAVAERGAGGCSLDQVLEAAGASKSQLYHYFADKDDLVRAVIARRVGETVECQGPMIGGIDSLADIRRWFDWLITNNEEFGCPGCPLGTLANELADRNEAARVDLAGGSLIEAADWSAAFWLFIPLVVAALVGMTVVPESRDPRHIGLDVPGAVIGTAGLTTLVYGIIRGGEVGWDKGAVVASFATAAVLLVVFAVVESRATTPMLPLRFLRERDLTGAVLLIGIVLFAMFVTFFFLTQYFQIVQGRSAFEAGLLLVAPAVGMVVGSGLAGKLIHTVGPRVLTLAMVVVVVLPLVALIGIIETTTSAWLIFVILGFFGLGAGFGMPAMTDTVMAAVPERDAGVGSALNDVSRQLGGALGVAIIGSVVNDAYRSNLADHAGNLDPGVVHAAGEGVGVASRVAATLPPEGAATLTRAVNEAYVDAIVRGFTVSVAVLVAALVVAVTMIPRRMRTTQAEVADTVGAVDAVSDGSGSGVGRGDLDSELVR